MAVDEVSRNGPKSHLSLYRHPEVSLEVVEETLLILQENPFDFLLELGDPVSRWVFSVPDLSRKIVRPSATGKINFPFPLVNITSFELSLLE